MAAGDASDDLARRRSEPVNLSESVNLVATVGSKLPCSKRRITEPRMHLRGFERDVTARAMADIHDQRLIVTVAFPNNT